MARWPLTELLHVYWRRARDRAQARHEAALLRWTIAVTMGGLKEPAPELPDWAKD